MAIKDCVDEIRKIAGDALSEDDIKAIAAEVQRRARAKMAKDAMLNNREALEAAADDIAKEADVERAVEQRNRALDLVRAKARNDHYAQATEDKYTPAQAIQALNVGLERGMRGALLSVDARGKAMEGEFLGGLIGDLREAKLLPLFTKRVTENGAGIADRELNRALWSIGEDGKVSPQVRASVGPDVARLAEIINKWQEAARLRSNRAGAFIRKLPGYVTRQTWDQLAIRAMTKQEFVQFLLPLLDHEATFQGKDPLAFLSSTYDAMSSGVHIDGEGGNFGFKGPGNLAKRMSAERVLFFKDADSWTKANQAIGMKSTADAVLSQLRHDARNVALMETWGTNPKQNFEDDLRMLEMQNRDKPKLADELGRKTLRDQFAQIDGTTNRVDNASLARWSANIRGIQDMAKLPLAALSHMSNLAFAAAELRHEGESLAKGYVDMFARFIENAPGDDKMGLVADLGTAHESMSGAIASRFSSTDAQPGRMSRLLRGYFKLNGMRFFIETGQSAFGQTVSANMGRDAALAFEKLHPSKRILLQQYGFDPAKWDVVRQGAQTLADGRKYLTPDGVRSLPDPAFAALGAKSARSAQRLRDQLSTDLQTFFTDRIDHAIPTPGAREKAIMNMGTQPGTKLGEGARLAWQFKQFPLTILTKVAAREFGKFQDGRCDILGVAHLIAATTVMGMFAMQAKQILKGRTPRNPFDGNWPEVWGSAFMQGGGAGLYGDFLFGSYNNFGGSMLDTAAGPTIGDTFKSVQDLLGVLHTKQDKDGNLEPVTTKADLLRDAMNNVPNLAYTRVALDYLVLYQLQEMLSPGYLKRMERRLKQQNNQTMLLPPSSLISRGGAHNAIYGR